jgi:hypothetical protein
MTGGEFSLGFSGVNLVPFAMRKGDSSATKELCSSIMVRVYSSPALVEFDYSTVSLTLISATFENCQIIKEIPVRPQPLQGNAISKD